MTTYSENIEGKDYEIEGPEGASHEQVIAKIKEQIASGEIEQKALGKGETVTGDRPVDPMTPDKDVAALARQSRRNFGAGFVSPVKGSMELAHDVGLTSAEPDNSAWYGDKGADTSSSAYTMGQVASAVLPFGALMKGYAVARGGIEGAERLLASGFLTGLGTATTPIDYTPGDDRTRGQERGRNTVLGMGLGFGLTLAGEGISKGTEWLAKTFWPRANMNIDERAWASVIDRAEKDAKHGYGPTASRIMQMMALGRMTEEGMELGPSPTQKPIVMADYGVQKGALKGLAGRLARSQGGKGLATGFLQARDKAAPQRLEGYISNHIWSGLSKFKIGKYLNQARRVNSAENYAKLDGLKDIWSEDLQTHFLENPKIQKGLRMGYDMARDEANASKEPFDASMMGVELPLDTPEGIKIVARPSMRVLDMGKRGLDEMIYSARKAGDETQVRILTQLKNGYLKEIDRLDTEGIYAKARASYAGPSRSLDLLEMGKKVFRMSPEEIEDLVKNELAPGEDQFLIAGGAEDLRVTLKSSGWGANEARNLMKTPYMKERIQALITNKKDADEFVDAVASDIHFFESKTEITGGSQSVERAGEEGLDLEPMARTAQVAHSVIHGRPILAGKEMLRMFQDITGRRSPEMEEAMTRIMFDPKIYESEMGRRIAAGIEQTRPKGKGTVPANIMRDFLATAGAGAARVQAYEPRQEDEDESEGN
jgi:hypothetical protein